MNKLPNLRLLITFQFGYLQWGTNQHAFVFEVTTDIFSRTIISPGNFLHPAILLPVMGEILIIVTLFRNSQSRTLTFTGLICMRPLMVLLLVVGLLSHNFKIVLSTIPYLMIAFLIIRINWKPKANISGS